MDELRIDDHHRLVRVPIVELHHHATDKRHPINRKIDE